MSHPTPLPAPASWLPRLAAVAGALVAGAGALVLAGWAFDIPQLKSVFFGLALVVAATAALVCALIWKLARSLDRWEAATQASRAHERLTAAAFDQATEGITITDADATIIAVNPAFTRITGYSAAEAIGRNPRILQSGRQSHAFYEALWRTLATEGRWRGEIINRRKSGEIYAELLSISSVRDDGGRVTNYVGVFADISERLEQERRLRELTKRLELALDAGRIGTWVWLIEPDRIEWDERMGMLLGPANGSDSRRFEEFLAFVHPRDRGQVAAAVSRCLETRAPFAAEFRVGPVEGEERVLCACGEVRFENGEPRQMSGVVLDITEQRRAEQSIQALNASLERRVAERTTELEAALEELEAFSYSVAHDLRSPLRALDGFSEILLEDYGERLDAEGRDHLQRIRTASQRMAQLIDDLLELSRIRGNQMEPALLDVSRIVEEVVAALRDEAPERKAEFRIAPNVRAVGDPVLIRIVLDNLLRNAWKYTSKQGEPKIEFGRLVGDSREPVLFVRDNGAGFDMRLADKLFKPFQRLHRTSEFPGSGIGLASAARAIRRHGGRIWADAAVGRGATFYFTLPEGSEDSPIT